MRLGRWSLGLAAVLFAVCACKGGSSSGEGGAQAKGAALKLGAALSMTGAAATYGQSQKNGLEAAAEELNGGNSLQGIKVELLIEDDATSKEHQASRTRRECATPPRRDGCGLVQGGSVLTDEVGNVAQCRARSLDMETSEARAWLVGGFTWETWSRTWEARSAIRPSWLRLAARPSAPRGRCRRCARCLPRSSFLAGHAQRTGRGRSRSPCQQE